MTNRFRVYSTDAGRRELFSNHPNKKIAIAIADKQVNLFGKVSAEVVNRETGKTVYTVNAKEKV